MKEGREHARFIGSMFISILAGQATMVVDASVGGNLLGADAMSAVDLVMPVYEAVYALVMMLGMGACTIASLCLGRGEVEAVRRHFTAAVVSVLVVLTMIGLGIGVFQDNLVAALCGDSYLSGFTRDYLVALIPYFVVNGLLIVSVMFTAMAGRPILVMYCAIVQFVLNISCNIFLLKEVGLGIEALAYSSTLTSIATVLMLLPAYLRKECPFRLMRCTPKQFFNVLGKNVRYGSGFMAVSVSYVIMTYAMNSFILKFSGEEGLFLWSVVMMIYITGDYASLAAQETSITLGGRYLGAGNQAAARMVFNRSLFFTIAWIALIVVAVFVFPQWALPLFGAGEQARWAALLPFVAWTLPFIAGVSVFNIFSIQLVSRGLIIHYSILEVTLYLMIPTLYFLTHQLFSGYEHWAFMMLVPLQLVLFFIAHKQKESTR